MPLSICASAASGKPVEPVKSTPHPLLAEGTNRHLQGDLIGAEEIYLAILSERVEDGDVLFLLGTLYVQAGRCDRAIPLLEGLLASHPSHTEAWLQLAHALRESSRPEEAMTCYETVQRQQANQLQAYVGMGETALALGDLDIACKAFQQAVELQPDLASAQFNLGLVHYQRKEFEAAERCYRAYLALEPDNVQGHFNLGAVLQDACRLDEANVEYERALALQPNLVEAHRGLGNIALHERRYADAVAHFHGGLAYAPQDVELLSNLGVMLQKLNRLDEAEAAFQQAISIQPDHVNAHFNLALVLLLKGDFAAGWREYEWRHRIKNRVRPEIQEPEWDGAALDGKTILLQPEQGFGDTFQFARYASQVKNAGGRVILQCQPGLKRILLRTPGIDVIAERAINERPLVPFDTYAPLLSLPGIFGATLENIPAEIPYIHPEPWLVQRWAARFARDRNVRVGIVWAGRPTHEDDKNRSCSIAHFLRLGSVPGVTLYSLQKGGAVQDLGLLDESRVVTDLDLEIDDFADTAAVIANLDVVICVDTSVAHLAGAMGKPVWVVLPFAPDWRWLKEGDSSPWYPSMRLFRQQQSGNWEAVFSQLCRALEGLEPKTNIEDMADTLVFDEQTTTDLRHARQCMRQGDWEGMASICEAVLKSHPAQVEADWMRGAAAYNLGQVEVALTHLARAYETWPQHPILLKHLADVLQSLGQREPAEQCYRGALQFGNDTPEVLYNLGALRQLENDSESAIQLYQAALGLKPAFPECLNNLGLALRGQGQVERAIDSFQQALRLAPDFFDPLLNLGNALYLAGRIEEAEHCFRRAAQLKPEHAGAHNALGVVLKSHGRLDEAIVEFQQALQLDPRLYEAQSNLGNALKNLGRLDEALAHYQIAIAHNPGNPSAWINLGNTLHQSGEVRRASDAFEHAIELNPDLPEAHWNRALSLLHAGDYAAGWTEYEWGIASGARPLPPRPIPRWKGETMLDKTLLVSGEQGLGDAIQFARFLSATRSRVGKIILECQSPLISLLGSCPGVDQAVNIVASDAVLADVAAQVPLMSLPGILGIQVSDLPGFYPYLEADPARLAWARAMIQGGEFKIGIVWAGSAAHQDDHLRSCDLGTFERLAQVPGVSLYSLQKGPRESELAHVDFQIRGLGAALNDFSDTSAAIACLDLIISVDTAVAHLAGAMGKPVWILLPYMPDWRWGLERESTPWYPSARLFRQSQRGDWAGAMARLVATLELVGK